MTRPVCAVVIVAVLSGPLAAGGYKTPIPFADVEPLWDQLRDRLPADLIATPAPARAAAWSAWVHRHDAAIRSRVARGDEDTLVNLWLFGTSFTNRPPASDGRLDDLLDALAVPGNDRLRWAGRVLRDRGIDPATPAGRRAAHEMLSAAGRRMVSEHAEYERTLQRPNTAADPMAWMAPYASLYRDRGLSSDTSLQSSHAVHASLEALASSGRLSPGSVRRVAIVGPGLDVVNKAHGTDFYPEQTMQPFIVADSLLRLRLAQPGALSIDTFDLSGRVNDHLADARRKAQARSGYVMHLPLGGGERWSQGLLAFWAQAAGAIATPVEPNRLPKAARDMRVRAVSVRPEVVLSVAPHDLDIVLERLDDARFDLVVATNVFIYYESFEQALALLNIAAMLRPGGSLLTNQAVQPVRPLKAAVGHELVRHSDRQFDHMFWYQRD